jgi:hypothetical protein
MTNIREKKRNETSTYHTHTHTHTHTHKKRKYLTVGPGGIVFALEVSSMNGVYRG